LVAVTVRVLEFPEIIAAGLATMATVAAAGGTTVTAVVDDVFPPAPVAIAV
jgi:hypothetical protein